VWYSKFVETGSAGDPNRSGRPSVSDETDDVVREATISANVYLDMLEIYVAPQLEEFQPWIIFEQDGAHPHWGSVFGCNISKQVDWER
jgi:hypothetical protein